MHGLNFKFFTYLTYWLSRSEKFLDEALISWCCKRKLFIELLATHGIVSNEIIIIQSLKENGKFDPSKESEKLRNQTQHITSRSQVVVQNLTEIA